MQDIYTIKNKTYFFKNLGSQKLFTLDKNRKTRQRTILLHDDDNRSHIHK